MKQQLIATKPFLYRTRRLRAGDGFEAPRMEARILKALYRAVEAPAVAAAAARPTPDRNGFMEACAEYQALTAAVPDRRWGEARIRSEIAAVQRVASDKAAGAEQPASTGADDEGSDDECLML